MTLTDAESDNEAVDAPELFSRQEHEEKYGKIAQLKTELHDEEVEPYLEQFYDAVTDDVLQIGSISIGEVQVSWVLGTVFGITRSFLFKHIGSQS